MKQKMRLCMIDMQSVQWVVLFETLLSLIIQLRKYGLFCEKQYNRVSTLTKVSVSLGVSQVLQVLAVLPLSSLLPWRDGMMSLSCQEVLEHLLTLLETSTCR